MQRGGGGGEGVGWIGAARGSADTEVHKSWSTSACMLTNHHLGFLTAGHPDLCCCGRHYSSCNTPKHNRRPGDLGLLP